MKKLTLKKKIFFNYFIFELSGKQLNHFNFIARNSAVLASIFVDKLLKIVRCLLFSISFECNSFLITTLFCLLIGL